MLIEPTARFSDRVGSYRRYRPTYPAEIADLLARECALTNDAVIADLAAGTGLLAEIFLKRGFEVAAIEPNAPMRAACASLSTIYPRLRCLDGTAEATGLADGSVDLITVGQAMHWFDLVRTREEFARILKPGGWCAVIYNHRRGSGDAFHDGYERILTGFGTDYEAVQARHLSPDQIRAFFAPCAMSLVSLRNYQRLTREALEGRILSSSYIPQPGQSQYAQMRAAIEELFAQNEKQGEVRLEYDCAVAYGQLR